MASVLLHFHLLHLQLIWQGEENTSEKAFVCRTTRIMVYWLFLEVGCSLLTVVGPLTRWHIALILGMLPGCYS